MLNLEETCGWLPQGGSQTLTMLGTDHHLQLSVRLSERATCRLHEKPPSLGTVLWDPLPVTLSLSLPPRACFLVASASHFYTCSGEEGNPWGSCPAAPSSLGPHPAQALCENLLWLAPARGWPSSWAWEIMSLPSHETQVLVESNAVFNLRACFEEFGFCDCLWRLCVPWRLYQYWDFSKSEVKNRSE